jgi:hypothetical protein
MTDVATTATAVSEVLGARALGIFDLTGPSCRKIRFRHALKIFEKTSVN